jgi:prepilin-type N-terminal cleavage/methylation domain-containing protein
VGTAIFGRASRRPRTSGFTLVELLIVIAIIGILVALLLPALAKAKCVTKNGTCKAIISDISRAFESYEADFGIYPNKGAQLTNDTRVFVELLLTKGPRFSTYYSFKDDDVKNGEYLSPHDKPFRYTFPAEAVAGPDGATHSTMPYLIWTWGCLGTPPECEYELNNWTH